jgi:hypothetical protein
MAERLASINEDSNQDHLLVEDCLLEVTQSGPSSMRIPD